MSGFRVFVSLLVGLVLVLGGAGLTIHIAEGFISDGNFVGALAVLAVGAWLVSFVATSVFYAVEWKNRGEA